MDKLDNAIASLREESHRLFMETMKLARAQQAKQQAANSFAAVFDAARQRAVRQHKVFLVAQRVAEHLRTVLEMSQRVGASKASKVALDNASFALRMVLRVTQVAPQPQDDDGPWAA